MRVYIASDHAAIVEKGEVVKFLFDLGFEAVDLGPFDTTPCDYPDYAKKVAKEVVKSHSLGILICGTGIGMSMAANKAKGIRCAVCSDSYSAKMTRLHNDANVLALGARVLGQGLMLEVVKSFVETEFSGEQRHQKRIDKIEAG